MTYVKEHKTGAIAALQAHTADLLDEQAALQRAKVACAGIINGNGAEVCAEIALPKDFVLPDDKELEQLLSVAKMPEQPSWHTAPKTQPSQPDRNPRVGFPLRSAAEVSAGNGAFMKYLELEGVQVKWFAELSDEAAAVAAKNVNKQAVRFKDLTAMDPADLPYVDLLVGGVSCQPWSRVGLQLGFTDSRVDTLFATFNIAAAMQPKAIMLENVAAFIEAASGKVWQFVQELARSVGYTPQVWKACASEWKVPQVRKRAFMIFIRTDIAKVIGMPSNPATGRKGVDNDRCGRVALEDVLMPFDEVQHLVVPGFESRVRWVRNPDLRAAPLSDQESKIAVVAGLMDDSKSNDCRVFVNFIPAVKANAGGLGGNSHLVAQRVPGSLRFVVRHLHVLEVIAMQEDAAHGAVLHHSVHPDLAVAGIGNSCPAKLFMPHLAALVRHCKPVSTFVPKSFEDIGLTPARRSAWQANMRRGHEDHKRFRANGDIDVGQNCVNDRPRHKRTMSTTLSVFPDALPLAARGVVWYTAEALKFNDPSRIVPVQEWRQFKSNFNTVAIEQLAVGFCDKAVVSDMLYGAQPGNDEHSGQAFLGPNHASGEREFRLVDKAFEADIVAGRSVRFSPECCPYVWPCFAHPTGAVPKHLRSGEV